MFLTEPSEKRKFYRLKFTNPVLFQNLNEQDFGGSVGCDISEGGIRVNFQEFVALGTELMLQVKLLSGEMIDVVGRVVWATKLPHAERYQLGLQFEKLEGFPSTQRQIYRSLNPINRI